MTVPIISRESIPRRLVTRACRGACVAALTAALSGAARAQMAEDAWSTEPKMNALNPGLSSQFRSGPAFPLAAYSAIGSSFAQTGHLAGLGWDEAQASALLEGMHAAFQGQPVPLDEPARRFLAGIAQADAGPRTRRDLPLSSSAAIGSFLAQSGHLTELGWNQGQIQAFLDGMRAAFQGKPVDFDEKSRRLLADTGRQIGDIEALRKLDAPAAFDEKTRLDWYMQNVRVRLGLQQSESGLGYRVEKGRGGPRPRPGDTIVITCAATDANGRTNLPQLSGQRIRTKMENLLPGLMEGIQMMTVDASAVFVLPPKLSFGNNPWPDGVQRGAPIIVTVVLHDVIPATAAAAPGSR